MTGVRVTVVGDALLDLDLDGRVERLCPDAPVPVVDELRERPRPGGAALAAALAAADGASVTLVTALGGTAGERVRELLGVAGVRVVDLGLAGDTPEKVRVRTGGRSLLRLDRGETGGIVGRPGRAAADAIRTAHAVLVADYGRGVAAEPELRAALAALPGRTPVVWDPHPRGPAPVPGVTLATPNAAETRGACPDITGDGLRADIARARALRDHWGVGTLAVTRGRRGAMAVGGDGPPLLVPAAAVACADPCGAGDRFASRAAVHLAAGAVPSEAVAAAVEAATGFVAAGGAAAFDPRCGPSSGPAADRAGPSSAAGVVGRTRAVGGTVVATGGCFDLLHAGHVAVLERARALGDCLVVLLNSDASVRRLKGPTRPLVPAEDRAAVLRGLRCVDAVEVFDEDTPAAVLDRLRPDVWAKGGDHALGELPEAAVVQRWGGTAVLLPYLDGHSTSSIVKEAARRGIG